MLIFEVYIKFYFSALVPVQFACKYVVWLCLMKIHYIYIYISVYIYILFEAMRIDQTFHGSVEKSFSFSTQKKSFAYVFGLLLKVYLFLFCVWRKKRKNLLLRRKTSPEVKSKS